MRHAHGHEVKPESFQLEDTLGGSEQLDLQAEGGAVLAIKVDHTLGAMQRDVRATMPPERGIRAFVKSVVDCEKISDLIPEATTQVVRGFPHTVVLLQTTLRERNRQEATLVRNAQQRGRLEGLDETSGIAHRKDVTHPLVGVTSRHEGDDTRGSHLGILRSEFRLGVRIRNKLRAIDITAVDSFRMLNLPSPPSLHSLSRRIGQNGFRRACPTADDGLVAKE